jgi:hypothetical protein
MDLSDGLICILDDPTTLPVWTATYDPALGGTNCDHDCRYTADGSLASTLYGRGAACPPGWPMGARFTVQGAGSWQCRDRGGSVVPQHGQRFDRWGKRVTGWYIVVDLMSHDLVPWWSYRLRPWNWG